MQQKVLLINSMEKLINHIVVSRKNQEQIFASLSKNDFKKIISNLEDQNQRLRKISMMLISQLLYNNTPLKQKFCTIMNIPTIPGRIALNTKLCPSSSRAKNTVTVDMSKNIRQVYSIIKQPISDSTPLLKQDEKQCLFWYINFEHKSNGNLSLEYLTSEHPQSIQISQVLDPIDSMVGFIMPQRMQQNRNEGGIQGSVADPRRKSQYQLSGSNRLVNNYFKPSGLKFQGFKNTQGVNQGPKVAPGYSTDREISYQRTINTGIRGTNTSTYHDSAYNYLNKSMNPNTVSPPLNQIKTNTIDSQARSKYSGIKIISSSNGNTTFKGRDASKSFQENPLFHGGNTTKVSYGNGGNIVNSRSGANRIERGYDSFRDRKIGEKYPAE